MFGLEVTSPVEGRELELDVTGIEDLGRPT
jgi:hypothetical protein